MKRRKQVLSLFAALVLAAGTLGGCGGQDTTGTAELENGDSAGGQETPAGGGVVSVHYSAGGFGNEWMDAISQDYKTLTGVNVKWVPSYSTGEIQSLLNSEQEYNDIVMPLLNMYQAQDAHMLEDLTPVYDAIFEGESVAIKEKMNQTLYEYSLAEDGQRYIMYGSNSVSAFCYNADTLDEAFGEGNWELPRTTNELLEMAKELTGKGYYAFSACSGINYNWDYLGVVWWAQYDGLESYNNFYKGLYQDEAGEWQQGTKINDAPGRRVALETLSELLDLKNGYLHAYAKYMNFEEAQAAFLSNGYRDDSKKAAFMVNGDWLENEMFSWLISNPQNIGMMRAPVVSELAQKLPTVQTEEKLAAVVAAVDEGASSCDGVSDEDFAAVQQARLMCYTATPNYPIGIPSYRPEEQKQLAKDFLVYLCSERAQKIYAKELKGLTMPYGYEVDETISVSDFIRTKLDAFGKDMIPVFPNNSSPMMYRGGLAEFPGVGNAIDGKLMDGESADSILAASAQGMEANWENYRKALETSQTTAQ